MPLTFSHPAAVLPFAKVFKRSLSATGLVIGSMVPDFEYFIRMREISRYSHTWEGLVWFDVPLGFVLVIVYEFFVKNKLIARLPAAMNRRLSCFSGYTSYYSLRYLIAIFLSVALGAASHIVWDGLTHNHGLYVNSFYILTRFVWLFGYRMYVFIFLQYFTTGIGALVVLISYLTLKKGALTTVKHRAGYWLQIMLVTVVVVAISFAFGLSYHRHRDVMICIISGGMIGLLIASLLAE